MSNGRNLLLDRSQDAVDVWTTNGKPDARTKSVLLFGLTHIGSGGCIPSIPGGGKRSKQRQQQLHGVTIKFDGQNGASAKASPPVQPVDKYPRGSSRPNSQRGSNSRGRGKVNNRNSRSTGRISNQLVSVQFPDKLIRPPRVPRPLWNKADENLRILIVTNPDKYIKMPNPRKPKLKGPVNPPKKNGATNQNEVVLTLPDSFNSQAMAQTMAFSQTPEHDHVSVTKNERGQWEK